MSIAPDITAIRERLTGNALLRTIDTVPRGHVRMETIFLYPEGSSVDLFAKTADTDGSALNLSDLGETLDWLRDVDVDPMASPSRRRLLDEILKNAGITLQGRALELPLASLDHLSEGIVRLGQTCLRVADLIYTSTANREALDREPS